jgi:hypothetical protein
MRHSHARYRRRCGGRGSRRRRHERKRTAAPGQGPQIGTRGGAVLDAFARIPADSGTTPGVGAIDETKTRDHIQQHADAVVRGDMDSVMADFTAELRPQVPDRPIAATAGHSSHRLSAEIGDQESVALIRHSGDTGELTIRSRWRDEGGRPVIVQAEPAG